MKGMALIRDKKITEITENGMVLTVEESKFTTVVTARVVFWKNWMQRNQQLPPILTSWGWDFRAVEIQAQFLNNPVKLENSGQFWMTTTTHCTTAECECYTTSVHIPTPPVLVELHVDHTAIAADSHIDDAIPEHKNNQEIGMVILPAPINTTPKFTTHLLKLTLPTFAAKFLTWLTFWDSVFTAVPLNVSLSRIQKFKYLRTQVSD